MRWASRILDWLCDRLGMAICFDGDLMAPDPDEAWWINASDDAPGDGFGGVLSAAQIQQVAATQIRRRP